MEQQFIALEIVETVPGTATLWAALVESPERTFIREFVYPDAHECMGALEAVFDWTSSEGIDPVKVEIVVWEKDVLVATLANHKLEIIAREWLDFHSFYAGQKGISGSEARRELVNVQMGIEGMRRAICLARLFKLIRDAALTQQKVIAAAAEIASTYQTIVSDVGLTKEIFPPEGEK